MESIACCIVATSNSSIRGDIALAVATATPTFNARATSRPAASSETNPAKRWSPQPTVLRSAGSSVQAVAFAQKGQPVEFGLVLRRSPGILQSVAADDLIVLAEADLVIGDYFYFHGKLSYSDIGTRTVNLVGGAGPATATVSVKTLGITGATVFAAALQTTMGL